MFFNEIDANKTTKQIEPIGVDGAGERLARDLINNAIQVVDATHIKFTMLPNATWPTVALYQIFAQTWGCIVNKDFAIEHGCWDGSFADGWSTAYRQQPSNSYSPLDSYYAAKSKYTAGDHDVPAMCGTGPYMSRMAGSTYGNKVNWDKTILKWSATAWENYPGAPAGWQTYRGGWNAAGTDKHSLRNIVVQGIAEWPTRKMMFLKGDFDSVAVPRANMFDLLKTQYEPLAGIRLYYDAPGLTNDVASFVFHLASDTPYPPKVGGTVNLDFFANEHIRRAFVRTLNFTTYLRDAWWGEAIQPASWWVEGLKPDEAKNTSLVPHNIDLDVAEAEFKLAAVWDVGFEVSICYNLGNDQRKIACEMIRDAIQSLNSRRPDKPAFKVNVVGLDWPVFLDYEELFWMPMFFVGWLADFAHPDNFARPYMHTYGDFAFYQGYSDPHVDDLIDSAIIEPDPAVSNPMYQELQYIYWRDCPGLPLIQALGRRFEREWVRGWYYNQLYPGLYFYDLWKTIAAPPSPCDLSAQESIMDVTAYLIADHGKADVEIAYPYGTEQTPAFDITFSVARKDVNTYDVPIVYTVVYMNSSGYIFAIEAYTDILGPGGSLSDYFTMDNPSLKIGAYTVQGQVWVFAINYYDTNETNNIDLGGGFEAKWLLGDVNNDRIVEMMDFYEASNAFMTYPGHARWNIRCDVYGEDGAATSPKYAGDGQVEMMDFYVLSIQFYKSLD
jgi:peptide/nickel transport system substrate-binding protein